MSASQLTAQFVFTVHEPPDVELEELVALVDCAQPPATQSPSLKATVSKLEHAAAQADKASANAAAVRVRAEMDRRALLFSGGDVMSAGVAS
ncbi:Hypothetical protein A7982_01815 [Minicystis rosea]|nr:Hypothetical protein A7982_01815 [Minicystis rosea]